MAPLAGTAAPLPSALPEQQQQQRQEDEQQQQLPIAPTGAGLALGPETAYQMLQELTMPWRSGQVVEEGAQRAAAGQGPAPPGKAMTMASAYEKARPGCLVAVHAQVYRTYDSP